MNRYNDLSVKAKIPIMLGIASIAVFTLICVLLMMPLRSFTLEESSQIARTSAELAGERLAVKINASATIMPARASVIAGLIHSNLVLPEDKRKMMMDDMETLVVSESTAVTNAWVILEPNALDGLDLLHVNHPGCNEQGVVAAKWNSAGKLSSADYEAKTNLYRTVKHSKQGMMSQPYWDELNGIKVQMVTAIAPILLDGHFHGVVATDYDLSELCWMVNSLNTIGDGELLTDKGIIVAHRNQENIGMLAENGNREILDRLDDGKMFDGFYLFDDRSAYKVFVPIRLGASVKPWFYAVDVPEKKIYENANQTAFYLIVYCIIGVALIVVTGWFLIRPMLNSVTGVTDIIRQLSLGRINLQIGKIQNKDEIGTMRNELSRLLEGLKHTAGFAHNIGEGNLNAEYRLLSDDDVLGNSLLEMRTSLQKAEKEQSLRTKEEEQRSWGTAGLAKFAEILRRDNNDIEALSYNVISNMVKYLGINQGGIFVINDAENDENRVLEMKACYAFDRKKFTEKQVRPGEGMVGTCYLEGEPIYMTEIPNEYITITSGLGDANPRALLICPLKVNDEIFGVIELASFQPFEAYQLEFVKKVSESIAATISTVNVNIRTNQLLEQTKLQAEEMANQEEELRQNMEEMQATQEESRRRENELQVALVKMNETQSANEEKEYQMQQMQEMIFDSFNMGEFSPEGVMTDINQNTINFFEGTTRADFVGKHLEQFFGKEEEERILENLTHGRNYENVHSLPTAPGKTTAFRHKFIPMCNKDRKLLRILMLAYPENI